MDDTGAAPRTSTGKVSDPDLKLQAIERLLLLAQRYITIVEVSAAVASHNLCTGVYSESCQSRNKVTHSLTCKITHKVHTYASIVVNNNELGVVYYGITMYMYMYSGAPILIATPTCMCTHQCIPICAGELPFPSLPATPWLVFPWPPIRLAHLT